MASPNTSDEIRLKLQAFCDENGVSLIGFACNDGSGIVSVYSGKEEILEFEFMEPSPCPKCLPDLT